MTISTVKLESQDEYEKVAAILSSGNIWFQYSENHPPFRECNREMNIDSINLDTVNQILGRSRRIEIEHRDNSPNIEEMDRGSIYWGTVAFPGDGRTAEAVVKLIDARIKHWLDRKAGNAR